MQLFETKLCNSCVTITGNRYVRSPAKYHESKL